MPVMVNKNGRTTFNQARMISNDANPSPINPKTSIVAQSKVINDEEVSRAGTWIQKSWQRTRWIDGTTHCWLGNNVLPGAGEGDSGLKFDYLQE